MGVIEIPEITTFVLSAAAAAMGAADTSDAANIPVPQCWLRNRCVQNFDSSSSTRGSVGGKTDAVKATMLALVAVQTFSTCRQTATHSFGVLDWGDFRVLAIRK